jgi:N-acylglucosamine 2-epimerase
MNTDSIKSVFAHELYDNVLPFWMKYSVDTVNGGYYNCLSRDGKVYDRTKYMWLHGRQVWMFSKLYNTVSQEKEWLTIARHGMDFMRKYAVTPEGRVYFSLNEKGQPVYLQRKIFTECFYAMALAEYGRASRSDKLVAEAKDLFYRIRKFILDPSLIGRPVFNGEAGLQTLAVPMIMLNVAEEVFDRDISGIMDIVKAYINQVKEHVINETVFENVIPGGKLHDSSAGRLLNPGHAIEAGWFLKHWATIIGDPDLDFIATTIIRQSFARGWDSDFGGIFYFLDAGGYPPTQLEWNMKLWWPHCEALYAFLLLYSDSREEDDLEKFEMVMDYSFSHFQDQNYGEWFGYLNHQGDRAMDFKGGPYKGCFHVPRSLYLCLRVLEKLND